MEISKTLPPVSAAPTVADVLARAGARRLTDTPQQYMDPWGVLHTMPRKPVVNPQKALRRKLFRGIGKRQAKKALRNAAAAQREGGFD